MDTKRIKHLLLLASRAINGVRGDAMKLNAYQQKIKTWEDKYGELSPEIQRKINKLVAQYEKTLVVEKSDSALKISEGTKLVREFKGQRHAVIVISSGYEYNGHNYKSLSAIANEITGARWNGKKFFGVAK